MFQQYDIDEQKHSSSDGQRIETQINTINTRYGSKYFGLKKGVSAYTMVFNHVPCNAKVIGTHEHESHFCLRHFAQQYHRHPARTTFHGHPRWQSGELHYSGRVRLRVRAALPRLTQENDRPGWFPSAEPLCRLSDQASTQDP